jgi:hypothetical protein
MLVGKSAAQVDGWIAKAYDAYRAMLRGEQAASKSDRCATVVVTWYALVYQWC